MIKDEEYIGFLKSIISCISHGDYYSVKELSNLELERMKKIQKEKEKNRYIYWYISFFVLVSQSKIAYFTIFL